MLYPVQNIDHRQRHNFGNGVCRAQHIRPLEAIDHQQAHHGRRKRLPQKGHHARNALAFREEPEGKKAGDHRTRRHGKNHRHRFQRRHHLHSLFLPSKSAARMTPMAGMMKLS